MKNYKFISKAVYLGKEKILVISDLHLGYEDALKEQGVFLPRTQYKEIIEDLEKIFEKIDKLDNKNKLVNKKTIDNIKGEFSMGNIINKKEKTNYLNDESLVNNKKENKKIKEIIILGDLKHEFAGNLNQEWNEVLGLIKFLKTKAGKIILIRGNHDNYLINVIKKQKIKLVDFYVKGNLAFIHGHKLFPEILDRKIKTIFLGHMHPAISISKEAKKEIYKCFLVGKFNGKEIVILPSFFPLVEGVDVSIEDTNLAFKPNLGEFEVFIPTKDEVYDFGKVKNVGRLMS